MTALYLLEQELARRCGPWTSDLAVPSPAFSKSEVILPTLGSSLPIADEWTGLYLLRRGLQDDGSGNVSAAVVYLSVGGGGTPLLLTPFLDSDRVRRVASYDTSTGTIVPDRPWTALVSANEIIELHYLDPTRELRTSLVAGLGRCYVEDRTAITLTGQATERDLTALAPWLTQKDQIKNVQWNFPGTFQAAMDVRWFNPFLVNGHVWLSLMPDPFPNTILITSRRAASTAITRNGPVVVLNSLLLGTPMGATTPSPHGFTTGQTVHVEFLYTPQALVGTYTVTVVNANRFTMDGTTQITTPTGGAVSGQAWSVTTVSAPFSDLDDVPVTVDYAAAAGLCAVWQRFPGRLIGGAQLGLVPTQQMAAEEMTNQTDQNYQPSAARTEFDQPFPSLSSVQRA